MYLGWEVNFVCPPYRDRVSKYMTKKDTEKGVDNFHYLSRDFNAGTSGIANAVSYTTWKFSGSVCWDNKEGIRTAITEVYGPSTYTWKQMRVDAGEVKLIRCKTNLWGAGFSIAILNCRPLLTNWATLWACHMTSPRATIKTVLQGRTLEVEVALMGGINLAPL